jgi:hypothetical protein
VVNSTVLLLLMALPLLKATGHMSPWVVGILASVLFAIHFTLMLVLQVSLGFSNALRSRAHAFVRSGEISDRMLTGEPSTRLAAHPTSDAPDRGTYAAARDGEVGDQ